MSFCPGDFLFADQQGPSHQELAEANRGLQIFGEQGSASFERFNHTPPPYRSRSVTPLENDNPARSETDSAVLPRLKEAARRLPIEYARNPWKGMTQREIERAIQKGYEIDRRIAKKERETQERIKEAMRLSPNWDLFAGVEESPSHLETTLADAAEPRVSNNCKRKRNAYETSPEPEISSTEAAQTYIFPPRKRARIVAPSDDAPSDKDSWKETLQSQNNTTIKDESYELGPGVTDRKQEKQVELTRLSKDHTPSPPALFTNIDRGDIYRGTCPLLPKPSASASRRRNKSAGDTEFEADDQHAELKQKSTIQPRKRVSFAKISPPKTSSEPEDSFISDPAEASTVSPRQRTQFLTDTHGESDSEIVQPDSKTLQQTSHPIQKNTRAGWKGLDQRDLDFLQTTYHPSLKPERSIANFQLATSSTHADEPHIPQEPASPSSTGARETEHQLEAPRASSPIHNNQARSPPVFAEPGASMSVKRKRIAEDTDSETDHAPTEASQTSTPRSQRRTRTQPGIQGDIAAGLETDHAIAPPHADTGGPSTTTPRPPKRTRNYAQTTNVWTEAYEKLLKGDTTVEPHIAADLARPGSELPHQVQNQVQTWLRTTQSPGGARDEAHAPPSSPAIKPSIEVDHNTAHPPSPSPTKAKGSSRGRPQKRPNTATMRARPTPSPSAQLATELEAETGTTRGTAKKTKTTPTRQKQSQNHTSTAKTETAPVRRSKRIAERARAAKGKGKGRA